MMSVTEAKYKHCKSCGKREKLIEDAKYICDECAEPIAYDRNSDMVLEITVHQQHGSATYFHFCSWPCLIRKLPHIKSDYFMALPFLHFDGEADGPAHVSRFLELVNKEKP